MQKDSRSYTDVNFGNALSAAIALDTPNTDATESAANVETVFDALLPFAEANSPATVHDCVVAFQIVL